MVQTTKNLLTYPTISMKHSSLTELPQLKTDLAQLNYAWEGTPPFQLPHLNTASSQVNEIARKGSQD